MGKRDNINHWVSDGLAAVATGFLWVAYYGGHLNWLAIPFIFACVGIRGVLYDPFLNLFNREKIDKESTSSNSFTDTRFNKIGFWPRRLIYAGVAVVAVIIYAIIK